MGTDAAHEEGVGRIPPQYVPQADRAEIVDGTGQRLGLPLNGGCYGGGMLAGDGDLYLPFTEHSRAVYCNQANYGPVSGGK